VRQQRLNGSMAVLGSSLRRTAGAQLRPDHPMREQFVRCHRRPPHAQNGRFRGMDRARFRSLVLDLS
jgi:hypothetical protein